MKLYVLSDLHNEFDKFPAYLHAPAWRTEADVVVLAGDIDQGVAGIEWAASTFAGLPVVYVAGNHEFYGGDWERTLVEMRAAAQRNFIHFLENDAVEIDGVRFVGCTLWTDFDLFGEQARELGMRLTGRALNDYRRISNDSPQSPSDDEPATPRKLAPEDTRLRHLASRAWLEQDLAHGNPDNTVVVTHHYPSIESCARRYRNDPVTAGFGSQLPAHLLARAKLWIHGHTHDSADYTLWHQEDDAFRETRVLCNPRGYPLYGKNWRFENSAFDPELLIAL